MKNARLTLILFLLIGLAGCENPEKSNTQSAETKPVEAIEKSVERGPVKMTVRLSPKGARLSDLLDLDIIVKHSPEVEIKPPEFGRAVGDFLISDYVDKKEPPQDNMRVRRLHYQLEPVHTGKHLIRTVSVQFIDKRPNNETKGESVTLETEPLEVNITSELGDKTPNLADLSPMQAPRPLPARPIWGWIVGGLGVLALAGGIFAWRRSRQTHVIAPEKLRSPEEIAAEELAKLLAENLHGTGQFKEFYVRLTGIVRRYIERTTGIHAPEQTTEEFLHDMRARKVFPDDRSAQLANFLEAADMVKYAGMQPSLRQIEDAIARAQEFVGLPSAFRPLPETAGAAR